MCVVLCETLCVLSVVGRGVCLPVRMDGDAVCVVRLREAGIISYVYTTANL